MTNKVLTAARAEIDQYRLKLSFDKDDLDDELEQNAQLMWEIGEKHRLANAARNMLKTDLAVLRSEHYNDIRKSAAAKQEKLTEGQVNAKIDLLSDILKLTAKLEDANLIADLWFVLTESFERRCKDMEWEAKLWISGYWMSEGVAGTKRAVGDQTFERNSMREQQAREEKYGKKRS